MTDNIRFKDNGSNAGEKQKVLNGTVDLNDSLVIQGEDLQAVVSVQDALKSSFDNAESPDGRLKHIQKENPNIRISSAVALFCRKEQSAWEVTRQANVAWIQLHSSMMVGRAPIRPAPSVLEEALGLSIAPRAPVADDRSKLVKPPAPAPAPTERTYLNTEERDHLAALWIAR